MSQFKRTIYNDPNNPTGLNKVIVSCSVKKKLGLIRFAGLGYQQVCVGY